MSEQKPFAWITDEAIYRLKKFGGNGSRRTVPIHSSQSRAAKTPLYTKADPDPLLEQMAEALQKVMDNDCPYTGNPSHEEIVRFWEEEKDQGRGEAAGMLAALAALSAYNERVKG